MHLLLPAALYYVSNNTVLVSDIQSVPLIVSCNPTFSEIQIADSAYPLQGYQLDEPGPAARIRKTGTNSEVHLLF